MSSGYIEYTGTGALAAAAYKIFALTTPATPSDSDSRQTLPTSSCRWSHLEVILRGTNGANTTTSVKIFLSWDSLGLYKIAGPSSALTIVTGTPASSEEIVSHQADGGTDYDYLSFGMDLGVSTTFPVTNPASLNTGGTPTAVLPARGTIYLGLSLNARHANTVLLCARLHWSELSKG